MSLARRKDESRLASSGSWKKVTDGGEGEDIRA